MRTNTIKCSLLIGLALSFLSFAAFEIPPGWFKSGSEPASYDMGIEKGSGMDGKNAATVKSITSNITGFGTLMQSFLPKKYAGQRIRLSGYVKTIDVAEKACLWLRVEQPNSQQSLAFDNMQNRPIRGTNDWKKYEIVLDVPANASKISCGALIKGTGQIWFDNLTLEVVDNSIATTNVKTARLEVNTEPLNLDFENGLR
ncbi:hypothetical protein [Flavobacterium sp. GT3R68]|uniref:hypothetical protein n=1 Tax=Flavobacterium sp. GT3R68 TaxID=2594437 RepID=UPI000F870880|nr:hypothetical protein [Flavobacterium sp. GT3R68]RTY95896.1 hypothetical protein EKL32_04420 [Flavobacterium sp. GSN2]TRW93668.1 hypothetical protein FNW07_01810 [Flavobacterium sp. GT3R68]